MNETPSSQGRMKTLLFRLTKMGKASSSLNLCSRLYSGNSNHHNAGTCGSAEGSKWTSSAEAGAAGTECLLLWGHDLRAGSVAVCPAGVRPLLRALPGGPEGVVVVTLPLDLGLVVWPTGQMSPHPPTSGTLPCPAATSPQPVLGSEGP